MSKNPLVLLVLAALLLVGALWALMGRGDSSDTLDARGAAAVDVELDAPPTDLAAPAPAGAEARTEGPATALSSRATLGGSRENESFDLADARWVSVTLSPPSSAPIEDGLAIVAFAKRDRDEEGEEEGTELHWRVRDALRAMDTTRSFVDRLDDDVHWSRRELAGSLTVEVPFAQGATEGILVLQSRYQYLEPVEIELTDDSADVLMEPELGAWITGRVVLPAGADVGDVDLDEDVEVNLRGQGDAGFFGGEGEEREAAVDEELAFELRAVPADTKYFVAAQVEGFVPHLDMGYEVVAGEHHELELPLKLGARIHGIVADSAGQPIAEAHVNAQNRGAIMFGGWQDTTSGADGSYELRGIAPGKITVSTSAVGWLAPEEEKLELADAEAFELNLTLRDGGSIGGSVAFPDGRPGAEASVMVYTDGESGVGTATADADGRFSVRGLVEGSWDVTAQVDEEGPWVALVEAVPTGSADLTLTLRAPGKLVGTVVDQANIPIDAFHVMVAPAVSTSRGSSHSDGFAERTDGSFELAVPEGEWRVTAQAGGYTQVADGIAATVPGPPIEIVLAADGVVRGKVLDPYEKPVAEAQIYLQTEPGPSERMMFSSNSAESEEDGTFELDDVTATAVTLSAKHSDWAASEPVTLDLSPGEELEDVVLRLGIGGTITGEVYDDEGQPSVGKSVAAGSNFGFGDGERATQTDERGRFVFEHVTPGKVVVTATPSPDELFAMVGDAENEETAFVNVMGQMRMETVEVVEGGEVHVVLGAKPKAPVRVFGVVTQDREPVPEVSIVAFAEGGALMQGIKAAKADEQGRYEIVVDRPGDYVFGIGLDGLEEMGAPFYIDVPEVEEYEVDLPIPLGHIEGRIVGPDGNPAADVSVKLGREGGTFTFEHITESNSKSTDNDGGFLFEHLRPGSYVLRAGGGEFFGMGGIPTLGAVAIQLEVREDEKRDVGDVRLGRAGTLVGVVTDGGGEPVRGATVFVRDATGRLVADISSTVTDGLGRFTYGGLSEGSITVSAQTENLVCNDGDAVRISEGQETEVELVLNDGAYFVVTPLLEGEPVRARLSVLDERGNEIAGKLPFSGLESLIVEGISSKERRVGPVPPGSYTLIATLTDGREAQKRVSVRQGQAERKVKLRFK